VPPRAQTYVPQRVAGALWPSGSPRPLRPVGCMRGLDSDERILPRSPLRASWIPAKAPAFADELARTHTLYRQRYVSGSTAVRAVRIVRSTFRAEIGEQRIAPGSLSQHDVTMQRVRYRVPLAILAGERLSVRTKRIGFPMSKDRKHTLPNVALHALSASKNGQLLSESRYHNRQSEACCCCLTTCASAAGPHVGARTNLRFLGGALGGRRPSGAPRPCSPSAACAG
jgi:hypothetical protein